MTLTLDLTILLLFAVLVIGVFSLVIWNRWKAWELASLAAVAALVFVGYWLLSSQALSLTMVPTTAWWNLERDYEVADVGTEPTIVLAFGTLALFAQFVLIANRFFQERRDGLSLYVAMQAACFLIGATIAAIAYPATISAMLMPITETKASGHHLLRYSQGVHSAVLTTALAFSVLAPCLFSRIRKI